MNGVRERDPPEVATAQETPIFGPTRHLTNARVKISMMATTRMRRDKKRSEDVCQIVLFDTF